MLRSLVGSEMCIRDRSTGAANSTMRVVLVMATVLVLGGAAPHFSGRESNGEKTKMNTVIRMVNDFMGNGQLEEAESILQNNVECCFRDSFSLLEQWGLVLHHLGHQKDAIEKYQKALALHPHHHGVAGLLSNLALSQEESGDDKSALKNYKLALKKDPKLKGAHVNIANYFRIHREWEKAAKNLKLAIEIDPRDDIAVGGLGAVYMDQHKWTAAEKQFRRAIKLNDRSWAARTELGNVLLRMNKDEEAKRSFETVVKRNPEWYRAHDGLAAYYIKSDKMKLAEKEAKAALALRSGDQYSRDLLDQARHGSREAEKQYRAVVTYSDQYDHITRHPKLHHTPHPEYAMAEPSSFSNFAGLLGLVLVIGTIAVVGWFVYRSKAGAGGQHGYLSLIHI
eukprot:TRINITY_DN671_c0_g1_i1.p1 TRINITY_DN671_c0_g1~~TRINITY_DN671_c0_g1_i1.p1  ORF type:complete len:408 (+),score=143.97 TRINITY_DN671_c0_g1_i1:42-1226(+)